MHRLTAALVVASALPGSGLLLAQDYPHAFPRAGAIRLVDNDRITSWRVVWPIGIEQPFHRHLYDMAGVYLRFGRIRVTRPDGSVNPPREVAFEIPRLLFQRKDITHKEEGIGRPGDPEQLAIQTDLKGYSPNYGPAPAGVPGAFPREGARHTEFDNDRVVFWDYVWPVNKVVPAHYHDKDQVQVFVSAGTIRTKTADGKGDVRSFETGEVRFVPGGMVDTEEATGGSPRAVVIELKQQK